MRKRLETKKNLQCLSVPVINRSVDINKERRGKFLWNRFLGQKVARLKCGGRGAAHTYHFGGSVIRKDSAFGATRTQNLRREKKFTTHESSQASIFLAIACFLLHQSLLAGSIIVLHAADIGAEMGVDPVNELPVEAGVSPVETAVIKTGHAIADHIAGEPAGGGKARHRGF